MEKGCKDEIYAVPQPETIGETVATEKHSPIQLTIEHENIRGPNYYSNENHVNTPNPYLNKCGSAAWQTNWRCRDRR